MIDNYRYASAKKWAGLNEPICPSKKSEGISATVLYILLSLPRKKTVCTFFYRAFKLIVFHIQHKKAIHQVCSG